MKAENKPNHSQGEWNAKVINSDVIEITLKDDWKPIVQLTTFDRSRPGLIQAFERIEANAARIVLAVNMHDELVERLKSVTQLLKDNYKEDFPDSIKSLEQLLQRAEPK